MLAPGEPPRRMDDRLPQCPVRGVVLADPVALRERVDLDRRGHQIVSAKRGSAERNTARPPMKRAKAIRHADRELPRVRRGRVQHRPAPAADHRRHRVERQDPLPLLGDLVDREHDSRQERQHLQEDGNHVADVAKADVDRGEEEADPEHGDDREEDESGRQHDLPATRKRVVVGHHRDEHGQADDEVDERHRHPGERKQRSGEVHLRDERQVRDQAQARQIVSAEAKYCIGSTPAITRLGYGVSPDGKFANLPKMIT